MDSDNESKKSDVPPPADAPPPTEPGEVLDRILEKATAIVDLSLNEAQIDAVPEIKQTITELKDITTSME